MKQPNPLEALRGNDNTKRYLKRMIEQGKIPNSLLFAGPEGSGKDEFAKAFATLILCQGDTSGSHYQKIAASTHPDLHIYRPEGKLGLHSMDALRQLGAEVYLPPNESSKKVFIVEQAHRMWPYSANALLKTFEEPPVDTVIILVTTAPQHLLPTILSRCQTVYFQQDEESNLSPKAQHLASILQRPKFVSYKEFQQEIKAISDTLEHQRKEFEENAREERERPSELTALQKEAYEKQAQGVAATALQAITDELFDEILSWYRDLSLLQAGGNKERLFYRESQNELEAALQRGEAHPIDKVQQLVTDAKIALERSLPLSHCFETLFLKLNRL